MKIAHVITSLTDGGAEAVLYRLCVADITNTHVVISLMDASKYGPLLKEAGIQVVYLNMPPGRITLGGGVRLWRLLRQHQPAVVQTWMYHGDLIGGMLARLAGIRTVCWGIHHSNLEPDKLKRSTILIAHICAALSRYIPARIISCSQKAAQIHQALGYMPEKFALIPYGYDLKRFRQDERARHSVRREWNIDEPTPLLGMVARFDPQKDHATLIAALGLLQARGLHFRCALVGTNMDHDNHQLKELLAAQNVDAQVLLVGPRSDIPAVMNALDLHVLSSAGEAFPNVLAEAMACGTPCVTTDVGDAALIVGDTGWVVSPQEPESLADAISDALVERQDTSTWQMRQAACRQRITDNFSLDRMVESYGSVWTALLQN